MADNYEAEKYYQKINANKSLKIKSSAYYNLGLHNASGVTKNTAMNDGTVVPVSLESLYVGNQGFTGHEILTNVVVKSLLPRMLRYGLLYHYFGYPVANVAVTDQQTETYSSNQNNKWTTNNGIKYPEKIIPRANLSYIMPFSYGGETAPQFYGTTYLQYCEDYHDGEFEYSNIWEASEGLPSLGSYYDLAKKADKIDSGWYQNHVYSYLRGDDSYGADYHFCRVDPVSVHYSMGHYLTLGDHRITENKSEFSFLTEREYYSGTAYTDLPGDIDKYYQDSDAKDYLIFRRRPESDALYSEDGEVDTLFTYPLNLDDGITLALMYNTSIGSYNSSKTAALTISTDDTITKGIQDWYYEYAGSSGNITTYDLIVENVPFIPTFPNDFSTTLISPPIASVQFATGILKQTKDQLYHSVTNPLTKTWAKAYIPSALFPPVGGNQAAQMADLGFGSIIPASLNSLGLGSYGPGQDMDDIMGGYAKSSWYENYNVDADATYFVLPGTTTLGYEDGDADYEDMGLLGNFRYSNIASAFKLVPKSAKTQEEAQYYLENPNETLNAIVPKILDYVAFVAPKGQGLVDSKNDSLKGLKKFRFSNVIPEKLSSKDIASSVVHNVTIGNKADASTKSLPLYGTYVDFNPYWGGDVAFDTALFGRVQYSALQNEVESGNLSFMYRKKPDNFMLIPADPVTLKTMLNSFPKDTEEVTLSYWTGDYLDTDGDGIKELYSKEYEAKVKNLDYGPMSGVNTVSDYYNSFIHLLSAGYESFSNKGVHGEANINRWQSIFNSATLGAAYGEANLQTALNVYTRAYRNIQACKFISDKFLLSKYAAKPKGASEFIGYYDPNKPFGGSIDGKGVTQQEWYASGTNSNVKLIYTEGDPADALTTYSEEYSVDDGYYGTSPNSFDSSLDEPTPAEAWDSAAQEFLDENAGTLFDTDDESVDNWLDDLDDLDDLWDDYLNDYYEDEYYDEFDEDGYEPGEGPSPKEPPFPPDISLSEIEQMFKEGSLNSEQREFMANGGFYFILDGYGNDGASAYFKPGQSFVGAFYQENDTYWYGQYFKGWSVEDTSSLRFPVWDYTNEYINAIEWQPLIKTEQEAFAYSEQISEFPQFRNRINYGLPDWVKSFSVYPSIERSLHSTGFTACLFPTEYTDSPAQKIADSNLSDTFNTKGILDNIGTYNTDIAVGTDVNDKDYNYEASYFHNLFPNAYEIDATMLTYKTADGFQKAAWPWMKIAYKYNPASDAGYYNVELRYVLEMEIDETKLISDLVGYGVFNLAGDLDKYVDQGFDPYDLLIKSNGNIVEDTELYEQYENYVSSLGSGDGSVDFSQFPWYDVAEEEEAIDLTEKENQLIEEFGEDYTNAYVLGPVGQVTVPLKQFPGIGSDNIGYLDNLTFVKITKEWVNGKGEFNKVTVTDPDSPYNGSVGFVEVEHVYASPSAKENLIFFEDRFSELSLAKTEVQFMSSAAKAFIPTWYNMETPYYHKGDAEYWVNVYLPDDQSCITDDQDLNSKKELAKELALRELLNFLSKDYTDEDINHLKNTYLVAKVEEGSDNYHIDLRPGDPIQVLVKIGAIYVKAFNSKLRSLQQLKAQSSYIISLDTRYYQEHITHATYALNRIHLDISYSPFSTPGFSAIKEAKRLTYVPIAIRKLIALNGYDINSQGANLINVGFDSDYKLVFMSYKEGNGLEMVLETGFDFYKQTEPFNYPNTMSLLYHHRLLKDPTLPWQTVVEQFLVDPKPSIVEKQLGDFSGVSPSNRCSPPQFIYPDWQDILRGLADRLDLALDLDPRFDLGSFQFSLLELFPPCPKPPSGKGPALYQFMFQVGEEKRLYEGRVNLDLKETGEKGKIFGETLYEPIQWSDFGFEDEVIKGMQEQINKTKEYVGDIFSSGEGLKDLKTKIFDLDDLYTYVLNYIDVPTLYARICRCFLDLTGFDSFKAPNFEIGYDNLSAGMKLQPGKAIYAQLSGDQKAKEELKKDVYSGPGGLKEFGQKQTWKDAGKLTLPGRDPGVEIDTADLFCSFCFNIPSVFMRLPTTNILDLFIKALKALLEFAIAQLLLELITIALEILLSCPEIQCPTGAENLKDYGVTNLNDVFEDSGINPLQALEACGLIADGVLVTVSDVKSMMDDVSSRLSSVEVLGLLDGTPTNKTLKVIESVLISSYPNIRTQLNNKAKIEDYFTCAGLKIPVEVIDEIEQKIEDNYKDPMYCESLSNQAEEKLLDKCGTAFNSKEILEQAQKFDVKKYEEIANVFRETDDLSTQLPPLFTDGAGAQSIMSQVTDKLPTMNYALDVAIDTCIVPIEASLTRECKDFVRAKKNMLVKQDDQRGRFGLIENILRDSKWSMGMSLYTTGPKWRSHSLVNNIDGIFNDIISGKKLTYSRGSQYVRMQAGQGSDYDENYIELNFETPKLIAGKRDYTNNYKFTVNYNSPELSHTAIAMQLERSGKLVTSSPGGYPDIYKYPKRSQNLVIEGNMDELGSSVIDYIRQYPLENSDSIKSRSEQSQTFMNMLFGGLYSGGDDIKSYIEIGPPQPNSKPNASELLSNTELYNTTSEEIRELICEDAYWATFVGIITSYADSLSKNGLLGRYDDNPLNNDELALAFNLAPLIIVPPIAVVAFNNLTKNLYRREIERLDLTPTQAMGGVPHQGLIDYEKVRQIIKKNYDISQYYDPNSTDLGPTHLALLEGWISAMCQMFAGEVFLKGVFSLSVIPKEILTADEMIVEFIYEEMDFWLNLPRNIDFKNKFYHSASSVIANKPEFDQQSQTLFDIQLGKEISILNNKDAVKYFIRHNLESPLSFVQQRVQALDPVSNAKPDLFNPIQSITHGTVLEILENFGASKELDLPYGSKNSLCTAERIDEFKNGKFFFQYYFKLTELETGSEKYNALIDKLNDLDMKLEASGEPGSVGYESAETYLESFESNESMDDIVVKIVNSFRWDRPTIDRGHVSRDSMTRIAKRFYNPSSNAVALPVIEAYFPDNWDDTDVVQTPEEVLDIIQQDFQGGADILLHPSSIEDIKKFIKFEDLFEKIELGVRLCYGFVDTDMTFNGERIIPVAAEDLDSPPPVDFGNLEESMEQFGDWFSSPDYSSPVQPEFQQVQAKAFRLLADGIDEMIDEDDKFYNSSIGTKSKIYKTLRISEMEDGSDTPEEFKGVKLKNYIFPLAQTSKELSPNQNVDIEDLNNWLKQNLGTLTDPEFGEYQEYDDVMLKLPLRPAFKETLNDMTSEITLSAPYSALFRYSMPISKILYFLSLYNVMEVVSDIPCNVAFDQTKSVLKQTIETIYNTKGTEAYKQQPTYMKEKGGVVGIASSANKITGD
tara:strand:- start:28156 stop:38079 length:9924 start_codon:yes stop_codon:yes gene_type:complete